MDGERRCERQGVEWQGMRKKTDVTGGADVTEVGGEDWVWCLWCLVEGEG